MKTRIAFASPMQFSYRHLFRYQRKARLSKDCPARSWYLQYPEMQDPNSKGPTMNWLKSLRSQPATCVGTTSRNCFSLVAFLVVFSVFSLAQQVQVYVSSRAGDRIALKPSLHFGQGGSPTEFKFEINDSVPYQKIDG